jgi:oligosaccharide repeat unit polymerase
MELVNFLRVGGFKTLFAGKAAYQSAVSELTGTLPSIEIMLLSVALLGLLFSISKVRSRKIWTSYLIFWLILSLPVILNLIVLGRRGPLLSLFIVFIVGCFYFKPLTSVKFKWIVVVLILYLVMGLLYGIRAQAGYVLTSKDWGILTTRITKLEFWAVSLNPASNEFGAPFGNFNTYILSRTSELRFGETYLTGLTIPIPRFIWLNKPRSITYEFRDTYFPDWAMRGAIAGTAYSSILEAYVNFGTVGVPIFYFSLVLIIGWLEKVRLQKESLAFSIFYLTLLPKAISFHRSSFEMPLFWPLILTCLGMSAYIIINSLFSKDFYKIKKPILRYFNKTGLSD